MCSNPKAIWLVAMETERAILHVQRADCGLWTCPECAHKNQNRWRWRIALGGESMLAEGITIRFVTITSHEKLRTLESALPVWRNSWKKLHQRMKTAAGTKPEYAMFPERHRKGGLHMHMLVGADLPARFWKDSARSCGLGYIADSKPVNDVGKAVFYVTKYVTKSSRDNNWPENFHRVRVSHGWPKPPESGGMDSLTWEPVKTEKELLERFRAAKLDGITVVSKDTGEIIERPYNRSCDIT